MKICTAHTDLLVGEESLDSLLRELAVYEQQADTLDHIGDEGFKDALINIYNASTNVLGRIANSISASFASLFKEKNSTDMMLFVTTNKKAIETILQYPYNSPQFDLNVPYPAGMKTTYLEAVTAVNKAFADLDTVSILKQRLLDLRSIANLIGDDDMSKVDSATGKIVSQISRHEALVSRTSANMSKIINPNVSTFGKVKPFKQLYKSTAEITKVNDGIVDFAKPFGTSSKIMDTINPCVEVANNIAALITTNKLAPSRPFVQNMQQFIRYLATTVETQGVTCQNALMLEHNHIKVLQALMPE